MPGRLEILAENTRFQVSVAILVFIVSVGLIGPHFTYEWDQSKDAKGAPTWPQNEPPSWEHKMGTNNYFRDVWAILIHGIRNSLYVGAIAGFLALIIAFILGGVGGYKGGMADEGSNLMANVFLTIPMIPLMIVLASVMGGGTLLLVAIIIAIVSWAGQSRAIRSQVLTLKQRGFVDLARITGKGDWVILFKEIIPNMLAYVLITFFSIFAGAIVAEAGISMLGLGPTNVPTLGLMLHWAQAEGHIHMGYWWTYLAPGLFVLILGGSLFMIGSVMDDALNPRLRGVL